MGVLVPEDKKGYECKLGHLFQGTTRERVVCQEGCWHLRIRKDVNVCSDIYFQVRGKLVPVD
jgi:hypothetical protein